MKEQKLSIRIHRTSKDIINYLLDPKNSSQWIPTVVTEETNELPVRIGTIFMEHNTDGGRSAYRVDSLEDNMFEFVSTTMPYHVRYTFKIIDSGITELEYFEWMDAGELPEPFTINILQKLKKVLES